MARLTKKDCPECIIQPMVINPGNSRIIRTEQGRLGVKKNAHVSYDYTLNKIISEWAFLTGKVVKKDDDE